MHSDLTSFFKRLAFFSCIVAGIAFAWNEFVPEKLYARFVWELFAFMNLVAIVSHILVVRAFQKKGNYFVKFYMGLSVVRMFLYMGIILAVIILFRKQAVNFTLTFLVFYILYTAFEVIGLLKRNKQTTA